MDNYRNQKWLIVVTGGTASGKSTMGSYQAKFAVIECRCSDESIHRTRVEGRDRGIPGWYEMKWKWVERGRHSYVPVKGPKLELDAVDTVGANFTKVEEWLSSQ